MFCLCSSPRPAGHRGHVFSGNYTVNDGRSMEIVGAEAPPAKLLLVL